MKQEFLSFGRESYFASDFGAIEQPSEFYSRIDRNFCLQKVIALSGFETWRNFLAMSLAADSLASSTDMWICIVITKRFEFVVIGARD